MHNIKYHDYVSMKYNREVQSNNTSISDELSVSFLDYYKYLLDADFKPLEEHLLSGIEVQKLSNRNNEHIIEGMLAVTDNDLGKKLCGVKKNYYICNAICVLDTVRKVFSKELLETLEYTNSPDIMHHNYCHILRYMLFDIDQLINLYNIHLKNNNAYAATHCRTIHSMSLHHVLRQSLYGQVSFHSFADFEIDAPIAVIRQIIEIRIRRAFGTLGLKDDTGRIMPLDLSAIFDAIRKHLSYIEFPCKFENLERIYKWSNQYIHFGQGGFSWQPFFIESFLREFSMGKIINDSWSFDNAIKVKKGVIEIIHEELVADRPNCSIFGYKPECIIIE